MNTVYDKARTFIYRNARPLDLARFRFHFEGGGAEAVLTALAAYQNADGGFGSALEADAWNPCSSPIQTWVATDILREIGFSERAHPLVRGIVRYLSSGRDFDGHFWYKLVRENKNWPHAPWWACDEDTADECDYNPSAALAGFLLCFAEPDSRAYALGERIAREAVAQLVAGTRENGMHTLYDYLCLLKYIERSPSAASFDLTEAKRILADRIHASITSELEDWAEGYVCKPSRYIDSPASEYYAANREAAEYECGFIERSQLPDGSWRVTWDWNAYPEEWPVSRNWWRSDLIMTNLLYLRGFGRL